MSLQQITGVHHITALAGSTQDNIDFYTGILGLRLVKKTVNFDAPEVYHFYYGDDRGTPGSILTFFPYEGLVRGRHGKGMLNTTAFSVPQASMDFWMSRLNRFGVPHKTPQERFDDEVTMYFEDKDGLGLELVFNDRDGRPPVSTGPVPPEHAIRGFYHAEIWEVGYERTAGLLTEQLDHRLIAEKGNRFRFAATDAPGNYVDLLCMPESLRGLSGAGTVHHIALATPDANAQLQVRERLAQHQLNPTPVMDRSYFTSVYFREPGGVLLEIATTGPGFTIDEDSDGLGQSLKLPAQFAARRQELEEILPAITVDYDAYR